VEPYTRKFGVTFPVAIDAADVFGQAFGLKAIPVTFLVDEVGIIRLRGGAPDPALLRQIDSVLQEPVSRMRAKLPQLPAARSEAELEQVIAHAPENWRARTALAQRYDAQGRFSDAIKQLEAAARLQPAESSIRFVWGLVLLHQNQTQRALNKLRQARDLEPDNWRIHKQIWAIEHPEKFYTGDTPDYDWQRQELTREKSSHKTRE
jgi:tetratricopeptide (TPR) repeat protein